MRVFLVVAMVLLLGAGGYGYFDLARKLDASQRRLEQAELLIASDRQTLSVVCNEYASAPKVENALNNLQGQINGLRSDVGHIRSDYASAQKVETRLAALQQQLKELGTGAHAPRSPGRDITTAGLRSKAAVRPG